MIDQLPPLTSRPAAGGGEGDAIRALPLSTRRRLIGAGFMSPHGDPPDTFAELWNDLYGTDHDVCEVVRRFVREAEYVIEERRRQRRDRWERATALRHGVRTYFGVRNLQAVAGGWSSYRAMRTAKGWAG